MHYLTLLAAKDQVKLGGLPQAHANSSTFSHILTIVLMTLAALAVLFVIIGGLRYILSQGDPQSTSKAKNTIITALVGLVIIIAAQALVSLVISKL